MATPPAVVSEGVLGLEALHTWNSDLVLNDLSDLMAPPYYRIRRITGLRDRADAANLSEPLTGRDGELFYPSALLGKTILYEGVVVGQSLWGMRAAVTRLLGAFASNRPGEMSVAPPSARGGVSWRYLGRVLSCIVDDDQVDTENAVPTPYQRTFTLSIRQSVPVYFESRNLSTFGTTSISVPNEGNAPGYPLISVTVATVGDLTVSNTTHDKHLSIPNCPVGGVVIDFLAQRIILTASGVTTDITYKLADLDTNWFNEYTYGMYPGANTITQSGGTALSAIWNNTSF